MTTDAIVVPLKRFDLAKDRLRQAAKLDVTRLAEDLALGVLRSSSPRHVIVLSESDEISRFADAHGAEAWRSEAQSLNEAVQGAYAALRERFDRLLIVHGDLSHPEGLGRFDPGPGITIVADRHRAGTNVLVVPTDIDFHFAYGPDSRRARCSTTARGASTWTNRQTWKSPRTAFEGAQGPLKCQLPVGRLDYLRFATRFTALRAGAFLATAFFFAGALRAGALLATAFFFAAALRAGAFLATAFFFAGAFLATAFFFAGAFLTTFFAAAFLAGRFAAAFLAGAFLAGALFFAAVATFPPWESSSNQFGTPRTPPW